MKPPTHPPGYKEGYYSVRVSCSNCHREESVDVPKGTKVDYYLQGLTCKYCGCKDTLQKHTFQ
jgi:hypothetical protein